MSIKKICVIGLGYIGLPTASTFASNGIDVVGMDVNQEIINQLKQRNVHIFEPGLRELVEKVIDSGKLSLSVEVVQADAYIIAVPTPFLEDKRADMRFVSAAAESIVPHLKQGNLVILESTSPPRTTVDLVAPILEQSGLKAGIDFSLAYSPERVLPGKILEELINNSRVIGGIDQTSAIAGRDLYKVFVKGEIILTDATTAEMVKLMENTSRDINIAIANEFCRLADKFGVDIWEAIQIANLHPRVKILKPGIGVGGHCISVDPWFLVEADPEDSPLVLTARRVNDSQPEFVAQAITRAFGELSGRKVAILGLAFKADVDDLRESPAVELAHLLINQGARLTAYEPYKPNANLPGISMHNNLDQLIQESELIIVAVAHRQFRSLNPGKYSNLENERKIFDAVNIWNKSDWEVAGFKYGGLAKK